MVANGMCISVGGGGTTNRGSAVMSGGRGTCVGTLRVS